MTLPKLSMALLLCAVNAAANKISLPSMIDETLSTGKAKSFGDIGEKYLNLHGLEVKMIQVPRAEAMDGFTHGFNVATDGGKAKCLVLTATSRNTTTFATTNFRADLAGQLEEAVHASGDFDAAGNPIPTSGKFTTLEPKAKDVKKAFQHELDFWLKGKFRKPPAKK